MEIFIGILLVCSCFNRRQGVPVDTTSGGATATISGSADQNIEKSSNANENSSSMAVVSYQRRHSHEEKSTNLDRPHIEEINQLQRRSSLDRKTFSILSVVELNAQGLIECKFKGNYFLGVGLIDRIGKFLKWGAEILLKTLLLYL